MQPALEKLGRTQGAPSTVHRGERTSGHFQDFRPRSPPLSRASARTAAPTGSYGNRRAAGPAPGDSSVPRSSSPREGLLLTAPRLRPVCRSSGVVCGGALSDTLCAEVRSVKGRGPGTCRSLEAHTSHSVRETWGRSPLCRDRAYEGSQSYGSAGPRAFWEAWRVANKLGIRLSFKVFQSQLRGVQVGEEEMRVEAGRPGGGF